MKEIELIEKRKPREKHFLREDGTFVVKVYNEDIHYKKEDRYEEIDNTLIRENNCFHNTSNDFNVRFQEQGKDSLIYMEKDDYYLDIKLKDSYKSHLIKKQKKSKFVEDVVYPNILEDIDIEYKTLPTKVKETIILKNNKYNMLDFSIATNLKLEQQESYIIAKNEIKEIFRIEPPYMEDSNKRRNDNINYKLIFNGDGYDLNLILDKDWLNSKETEYPVYIDPTITNINQSGGIYDTYIYPGDTNADRNKEGILKAGVEKVNGSNRTNRTLIKFDLPEIGTGSEIIDAEIVLIPYHTPSGTAKDEEKLVTVHQVTEDWTESNATWDKMHDKYNTKVESIFPTKRSSIQDSTIISMLAGADITNLVKNWYRETPNYGVLLKSASEEYIDDEFPAFFSKDNKVEGNPKPYFSITYRNQNGLEEYWDYQSQEFTDGTTHINTFNGNMIGVFTLGYTVGGRLPATIHLIYNTNDAVLNQETFFGKGYRLNYEQTIKSVTINNEEYLEYIDGDSTIHYFQRKSSLSDEGQWITSETLYVDEDGLELEIEKSANYCILSNKLGDKLTFTKNDDKYFLTKITDSDENCITITLDENNKVIQVQDALNNSISLTYQPNVISVSNSNDITKLIFTDNEITQIQTKNGFTTISYNDNGLIEEIEDVTGTKYHYIYYTQKPYRIKEIIEYGLNNSQGTSYIFEYGFDSTTISDNKGRNETLIFNSAGNLLSINSLGKTEDISNAYSVVREYGTGAVSHDKNKIISSTIPVKYIKNLLKNTDFENDEMYFEASDEEKIQLEYATDDTYSGGRFLKVTSVQAGTSIEQTFNVPKGKFYTFSGLFKTTEPCTMKLKYTNEDGKVEIVTEQLEIISEFEKKDITIFYSENATTDLKLSIDFDSVNTIYIDSIQLEEGEVANNYNIIENSDFSNGILDWNTEVVDSKNNIVDSSQIYEIIKFNDNANTALKIKMNPNYVSKMSKKFNIKGKEGDLYTIAFWYKNEGVKPCRPYAGNNVTINFIPEDNEAEYCIVGKELNTHYNSWQYFSYRNRALEDFKEIELIFTQNTEANDLYITNISFYKEITSGDFNYDDYGNIVEITDQSNEKQTYKYDSKNQLIQATDPKGKDYKFEYDNIKTNRLLSAISCDGISNQIKYDNNGNPNKTKILKLANGELSEGKYKIRHKGTDKYIKAKYRQIMLEENDCSNTIWNIQKVDNQYKLIHSVIPSFSLSYDYDLGLIYISDKDKDNLFSLESAENGAYYLGVTSTNSKKHVKATQDNILLEAMGQKDSDFEFYIELVESKFEESTSEYTEDGRFISSVTASDFSRIEYNVDNNTGLVTSIKNNKGQTTSYDYNNKNQLISIASGDKKVFYNYNSQNLLSSVTYGNRIYNFEYNDFLKPIKTKIGNNINLITHEYEANNGNLISSTFGNNQKLNYVYDKFDRIIETHLMDDTVYYKYDNNGNLSKIISTKYTEKSKYDIANRLYEYIRNNFKIKYTYDENNSVIHEKYELDNVTSSIENVLNEDELVVKNIFDGNTFSYQYDTLGRITNVVFPNSYKIEYQFLENGKRTTNIIKKVKNGINEYSYIYDELGNIKEIYLNDKMINKYDYDLYNQLIKSYDYDLNEEFTYTYDNYGNILSKTHTFLNNNTTETKNYLYDNSNWGDILTNYDGNVIVCDEIGNTKSINNSIFLEWVNGRNLKKYTDNAKQLIVNYEYDANNIRTKKTVNGKEIEFYLENNNIIYEDRGEIQIYYLYGSLGLQGLKYNNEIYYYVKNLQGDIIGILNSSGVEVVKYKYDDWGNIVSITDENGNKITDSTNVGLINPFRFKGYYYDEESNLYYLNSRYYSPEWGRFINADTLLCGNQDFTSLNLYSYASNNPIILFDNSGHGFFGDLFNSAINAVKSLFGLNKKKNNKKNKKSNKKKKKDTSSHSFSFSVNTPYESKEHTVAQLGPVRVTIQTEVSAPVTAGSSSAPIKYNVKTTSDIEHELEFDSKFYKSTFSVGGGSVEISRGIKWREGVCSNNLGGYEDRELYLGYSSEVEQNGITSTDTVKLKVDVVPVVVIVGGVIVVKYLLPAAGAVGIKEAFKWVVSKTAPVLGGALAT